MGLCSDWFSGSRNESIGVVEGMTGIGYMVCLTSLISKPDAEVMVSVCEQLGPGIGGWLFHIGGFKLPFLVLAALLLMQCFFLYVGVPILRKRDGDHLEDVLIQSFGRVEVLDEPIHLTHIISLPLFVVLFIPFAVEFAFSKLGIPQTRHIH